MNLKHVFITALLVFSQVPTISAQYMILPLKHDDFDRVHSWWDYHRDGSAANDARAIINGRGYLLLTLQKPIENIECNVGISEAQNIYGKSIRNLRVETRLKLLNEMQPGSRGWGFWKAAKGGKASSLCWFMQQFMPGQPEASWQLVGTLASGRRSDAAHRFDDGAWHTYAIERSLDQRRTDYFVDGERVFSTPGLAPTEDMSFHLWIDNQVYSRNKGIQAAGWTGKSALIVDYVRILTDRVPKLNYASDSFLVLHKKPDFPLPDKLDYSLNTDGPIIILANARVESYDHWSEPDRLQLSVCAQNVSEKVVWDGSGQNRFNSNRLITIPGLNGEVNLRFSGEETPQLFDVCVFQTDRNSFLVHDSIAQRPASPLSGQVWKSYEFNSNGGEICIYLTGSANEAPKWNHYDPSVRDEKSDDRLWLLLDGKPLGQSDALIGNDLFGEATSLIIRRSLPSGNHTLSLLVQNRPLLQRLLVMDVDRK